MRADLMRLIGQEAAVVAAAPAGAGKSHFVAATVGLLRAAGLRVALAAPTNDQVQSLVQRVKELNPDLPVAFVHGQGRDLPPDIAALPGVTQPSAADAQRQREPLVIATIDKLADAFLRNGLGGFDVLVIDEAYQADAAQYYTAAAVAPTHLLVGDTGQLDPFSPLDDATYWRGGPEDPLQTAVGVLLRNHPGTAGSSDPGHLAARAARCSYRALLLSRPSLQRRGPLRRPPPPAHPARVRAARH